MRLEHHPATEQIANKVVLLLDRSSLMPWDAALPALGAFLNLLQVGDRFAVLGYRVRPTPIYPIVGLVSYDDRAVITQATNVLLSTTAGGERSNLAAALAASRKRLDSEPPPQGMVLVASSPSNYGRNPLGNLPDYPIETIALGAHGQEDTLRAIAQKTGGTYAFAEDTRPLMGLLLDCIERLGIAQILSVGSKTVSSQKPYNLVGRVPTDSTTATFLVYWGDPAVTWGTGSGPAWVTAELTDPNGKKYEGAPVWANDGFVVFSVPSPAPGSWSLAATYVGPGTCTFTNAILD